MIDDVPPALARILEGELAPDERLLWHAMPAPLSRMLAAVREFLVGAIFMILFFGFLWGNRLGLVEHRGGSPLGPIEIMFALIGVVMIVSPLRAWWVARHTLYAITDRRAILLTNASDLTIQSFTGERLITILRRQDRRGRGDIVFEREASRGNRGRTVFRDVGFLGIADAPAAENLLWQIYRAAHPTTETPPSSPRSL